MIYFLDCSKTKAIDDLFFSCHIRRKKVKQKGWQRHEEGEIKLFPTLLYSTLHLFTRGKNKIAKGKKIYISPWKILKHYKYFFFPSVYDILQFTFSLIHERRWKICRAENELKMTAVYIFHTRKSTPEKLWDGGNLRTIVVVSFSLLYDTIKINELKKIENW